MTFELFIFYVFALIAISSAVMVVASNHPVRSALFLVLTFFATAGLWILAQAEFLALILVLVYVGAVMTLFLFVIMMLDTDTASMKQHFMRDLPAGIVIVGLLTFLMIVAINPEHFNLTHLQQVSLKAAEYSNSRALGTVLYTHYVYAFELAGVILLAAIIAAITLTYRGPRDCKTQEPAEQIQVRKEDRLRIVKGVK